MLTLLGPSAPTAPLGLRGWECCMFVFVGRIPYSMCLKLAIQPVAIYGTTRHIAIQPVIQPVVIYGTAVQTVQIQRFLFLKP